MVLEGLLVIIKPIYINEMTILPKKSANLTHLDQNYGHFRNRGYWKKFRPRIFMVSKDFHPWKWLPDHSGHHDIHQHTWKIDISHKNHPNWSIRTEIRAILGVKASEKKFAQGLSWFQRIFTLENDSQTLLVIMISTSTSERWILASKIIKIG